MSPRTRSVAFTLGVLTLCSLSTAAAHLIPIETLHAAPQGPAPEIPAEPRRIVSLISVSDEVLVSLDLSDRIIALSRLADDEAVSNVRARARSVPHRVRAIAEEILPLRPDLIFLSPFNRPEMQALLRQASIPTLTLRPAAGLDDIRANIRTIGQATLRSSQAESMIRRMDQTLDYVQRRVAGAQRPRVLFYESSGRTAGQGTTFDEILQIAGGQNVATELGLERNAAISLESALAANPEVILTLDYRADGRERAPLGLGGPDDARLNARSPWHHTRAVRTERVYALDPRGVLSTSHYIARSALEIGRALHPTRFEEVAEVPVE